MKTTRPTIEAEGDCYPRKDVRKMRKLIMRAIKETEHDKDRNNQTDTEDPNRRISE